MSSIHVARQGFVTKSALPSVSRERGTTTVADNSTVLLLNGNGTNAAQNNTFVTENFGSAGGQGNYSVAFDGTGDYLSAPSNAAFQFGTGDFTIEGWVYISGNSALNPDSQRAAAICSGIGASTVSNDFWFLIKGNSTTTGTGIVFRTWNSGTGTNVLDNDFTISQNAWHHIAISRSGNTVRLFFNGALQATSTYTGTVTAGSNPLNIGYSQTSVSTYLHPLNGAISNLRIVKGTAVYTSAFTPPTSELTAISGTSLLTCQGTVIRDASSNNFAITVNGDAKVASNTSSAPIAITRNGNATQGSFSPFTLPDGQWSNYFDGTGDYLTVPSGSAFQFGTGNFTIEAWVYANSALDFQYIIDARNSSQLTTWAFAFGLGVSGRLGFYNGTTTILEEASTSVTPNTWVHCAVVRSGTTFSLFINGTRAATTTDSTNYSVSPTISYIGSRYSAAGSMNGYLSNVRTVKGTAVYDPTLTTLTVPTTPLTAITNTSLLTCQSNRFRDASSNNFAITRNGDVRVTPWSPFAPTSAYDPATNGGSGYFDGTGDFISVPDSSSWVLTGDFNIEGWIYTNSLSGTNCIISQWGGASASGTAWALQITTGGRPQFVHSIGSTTTVTTGTTTLIRVGSWNHVAVSRSGTTIRLFVNGELDSTTGTASGSINDIAQPVVVGGLNDVGTFTSFTNGYLSSVRLVKGTAVYTANFTPPTAPVTNITNTSLLLNFTNAGIFNTAGDNVIETVGNAQISTSVKKYGSGSLAFDGTGDWLQLPITPELYLGTTYTIEAWIYPSTTSNFQPVISITESNVGGFTELGIYRNGTSLVAALRTTTSGSSTSITAGTLSANTWYHIALSVNSTSAKLFLNGTQIGSTTTFAEYPVSKTTFAAIGNWGNGFSASGYSPWNGYIDDLRITKGFARYTANFTPPTAELAVYGTVPNIVNNSTYGVYQLA